LFAAGSTRTGSLEVYSAPGDLPMQHVSAANEVAESR